MPKLIKSENFNRIIKDQKIWNFDVKADGVYLICISARCKNWLQNFKLLFNDDDLAVQIDDYLFVELKGKKREFTIAGSWNGNTLKNLSKKVLFILPLKSGVHKIKFWADKQPYLESIKIYEAGLSPLLENGFYETDDIVAMDIVFKNVKINELEIGISVDKKSKLSLKVDGRIQENINYKKYKKWYWYGQELQGASKKYQLTQNWVGNMHSLEFSGIGNPRIKSLKIKLRDEELKYKIGKIKIYKDIISSNVGIAYLREKPKDGSKILAEPKDGNELEIINERVEGEYMTDYGSEIWHEVIYQGKKGFILSTLVEIAGQERDIIIDLIKEKCRQYGVDQNIMLAIAGRESHYKPYQKSESDKICRGIFQLSEKTTIYLDVNDSYDIYQNIDGGVRYYKEIEGKFTGRGKILERRLAAWHDGPNADHISEGAKIFIKNVLANIEKKNWHHIISLPILILIVTATGLFLNNSIEEISSIAIADVGVNLEPLILQRPINKIDKFPATFLDEKKNQIIFFNSNKKFIKKIDAGLLNLNRIFNITPDYEALWGRNLIYIDSDVVESPENVFYFLVSSRHTCGIHACASVLYRFDAQKDELKILDKNVYEGGTDFYLSPDAKNLTIISSVNSGACTNSDYVSIIDLLNFQRQIVQDDIYSQPISFNHIENFEWKNNQKIEFGVYSFNYCGATEAIRATWSYNLNTKKLIRLKSEKIIVDNRG